jgi:CcmD family protein
MEPVYTVMIITLIVWFGIFGYMLYLDNQVKKLRKKVQNFEKSGSNPT